MTDFRYPDGFKFPSSALERFDANINAMELVKQLDAEGRRATPEEKLVLASYTGWGGSDFNSIFAQGHQSYESESEYNNARRLFERYSRLESATTPDELASIRRSRLNAFYTPERIIDSMWAGLERMGISSEQNLRVLEPSAGVGRFLGMQPEGSANKSERYAVEIDPFAANILRHTYPDTTVINSGLEDAPLQNDYFDVVISNIPFDGAVSDPEFRRSSRSKFTSPIHSYFFAKALDKVKPGGIIAFVAPDGTLDNPSLKEHRRYLANQADLLGAIRLPSKAIDNTDTITDIIYLRKRKEGEPKGDDSWVNTQEVPIPSSSHRSGSMLKAVNSYFVNNPDKILGSPNIRPGRYYNYDYTVDPTLSASEFNQAIDKQTSDLVDKAPRFSPETGFSNDVRRNYSGSEQYVLDGKGNLRIQIAGRDLQRALDEARRRGRDVSSFATSGDLPTKPHNLSKSDAARVTALVGIRDRAAVLFDLETSGAPGHELEPVREEVRKLYDAYQSKYGFINTKENKKLFNGGRDDARLFSLERYNEESKGYKPADILIHRVIGTRTEQPMNVQDAMVITRYEKGYLDFEDIGAKIGISADDAMRELLISESIYLTPEGIWETAADYLSGDIQTKLNKAQIASFNNPQFERNVQALTEAMPEYITDEYIRPSLGSPWIPEDIVNDFIERELRPLNRGPWVTYIAEGEGFIEDNSKVAGAKTGGWVNHNKILPDRQAQMQWGFDEKIDARDVLMSALHGDSLEVKVSAPTKKNPKRTTVDPELTRAANEKVKELDTAFQEWVFDNPERKERVMKEFNSRFNTFIPRKYDGSSLRFPGMTEEWQKKLMKHQRDAIARMINEGTLLLGHEMGFGKSVTMAAAAMERKRLGLINKPLFVVPRSTLAQFVNQFRNAYPSAAVLSPAEEEFKPQTRDQFLARIPTNDWDAVIITSEQLSSIPLKPETEREWYEEQLHHLREQRDYLVSKRSTRGAPVNALEKRIQAFEKKINDMNADVFNKQGSDTIYFDDLGVDSLFVDEADRYKNLYFTTYRDNVKGIPNSASQRAWDMFMKVRYLQRKTGLQPEGKFSKGGIVFATGTPIANSTPEMYTMKRYLAPEMLERVGITSFDAWADTFGEIETRIEANVVGEWKPVETFTKSKHRPLLLRLFYSFADIKRVKNTPEMLARIPRVVGGDSGHLAGRTLIVAKTNEALAKYAEKLRARAERLERIGLLPHREPDEESPEEKAERAKIGAHLNENMLTILNDGRLASLHLGMVEGKATPPYTEGKIAKATDKIAEIYHQESQHKGTQLVFLDRGAPQPDESGKEADSNDGDVPVAYEDLNRLKNAYKVIRNELIGKGVQPNEIAFIQDAANDAQRLSLFDKVNSGKIRVLIGSTDKAGVGVNVNERLAAAHHMDAGWRPRDIEQREGRILRQGNKVYGPRIDGETGTVLDDGKGIKIFFYVQEQSTDEFMWQAIDRKQRSIGDQLDADPSLWEVSEDSPVDINYDVFVAAINPNPLARRRPVLTEILKGEEAIQKQYDHKIARAKASIDNVKQLAESRKAALPGVASDADYLARIGESGSEEESESGVVTVGDQTVPEKDAGRLLNEKILELEYHLRTREDESNTSIIPSGFSKVGAYKGFDIYASRNFSGVQLLMHRSDNEHGRTYRSDISNDATVIPVGNVMRAIKTTMKSIPIQREILEGKISEHESDIASWEAQLATPPPDPKRREFYTKQLQNLNTALMQLNFVNGERRTDYSDIKPEDYPHLFEEWAETTKPPVREDWITTQTKENPEPVVAAASTDTATTEDSQDTPETDDNESYWDDVEEDYPDETEIQVARTTPLDDLGIKNEEPKITKEINPPVWGTDTGTKDTHDDNETPVVEEHSAATTAEGATAADIRATVQLLAEIHPFPKMARRQASRASSMSDDDVKELIRELVDDIRDEEIPEETIKESFPQGLDSLLDSLNDKPSVNVEPSVPKENIPSVKEQSASTTEVNADAPRVKVGYPPTNWVEARIIETEAMNGTLRIILNKEGRLSKIWDSGWNPYNATAEEKRFRENEEKLNEYYSILATGDIPEPRNAVEWFHDDKIKQLHAKGLDYHLDPNIKRAYEKSDRYKDSQSQSKVGGQPSEWVIGRSEGAKSGRAPNPSTAATAKQIDYIHALVKGGSTSSNVTVVLGDTSYLTRREASNIISRLRDMGHKPKYVTQNVVDAPWKIQTPIDEVKVAQTNQPANTGAVESNTDIIDVNQPLVDAGSQIADFGTPKKADIAPPIMQSTENPDGGHSKGDVYSQLLAIGSNHPMFKEITVEAQSYKPEMATILLKDIQKTIAKEQARVAKTGSKSSRGYNRTPRMRG